MERFFNNIGNTFSESLADLGRQFHPQNGQRQAGQPPPIHSNSNNNNNRPQAAHDKPPPASRRYILGLAENPVTSDDVIEVRGPVGGCTHQMEVKCIPRSEGNLRHYRKSLLSVCVFLCVTYIFL